VCGREAVRQAGKREVGDNLRAQQAVARRDPEAALEALATLRELRLSD
jgi:hypothetical protein